MRPNRQGFLTNWLIAGPKLSDFKADKSFDDQLKYEKYMRSILHDGEFQSPPEDIALDAPSPLGMPWRYSGGANWFVDVSVFYSLPVKVELLACCELSAGEAMRVQADLWTYAAIDLWLNGEHLCTVKDPVYKPITRRALTLDLKPGTNRVYVRMQNLGVRDTRSIFGLQLREGAEKLSVGLPGGGDADRLAALDEWLAGIRLDGETLQFPGSAPCEVSVLGVSVTGEKLALPAGTTSFAVEGKVGGHSLSREIEVLANIRPRAAAEGTSEEKKLAQLHSIAATPHPNHKFTIFNVLARYALGQTLPGDRDEILKNVALVEDRIDCSDFIAAGLIRLMKLYTLDADLLAEIRRVFLNYRFWMDEKGADGMCFWSENHALLFYGAQMLVGGMYPDDVFARSGRTGREQAALGERRVGDWLDDILTDGFEEYNSSGYMCVTLGALLNVIDFGPEELSGKAVRVLDSMLEQLCLHSFDGSVLGPQGRVYRDVIYPFVQGTQGILHYLAPDVPFGDSHWLSCLVGTKYRLPEGLRELMEKPVSKTYTTGNAKIAICKNENYILTSAQSPRDDLERPLWENISFDPDADKGSYRYVKSLNERFHGTTCFEPGVFGYQQHMWYAALSSECVVFSNHPGGTIDKSTMRPGYWYGNGIFPAVKQRENMLGAVYTIPESYPIHFTHLFFPAVKFDEYELTDGWLFARKGEGWLGVWCSGALEWHDDVLFQSELRCYDDAAAYLCVCSDKARDGSFEGFKASCLGMNPRLDTVRMTLTCGEDFTLRYAAHTNMTQYI